jgi:antitoxin (DNA-binding transcriptional repressor) of toxin-antitoxin stability system
MAKNAAERKIASGRPLRRLSATELAKKLSDVLNRVHYQRETVIVERGGKPVCQLAPVPRSLEFHLSDLVALLDSLSSPGEGWAQAVAQGVAEQDEFEGFEWPR